MVKTRYPRAFTSRIASSVDRHCSKLVHLTAPPEVRPDCLNASPASEMTPRDPMPSASVDLHTAVILGNERDGVSDEAKRLADGGVYISMNGFTESLNVSVASSMIMHHAVQDRTRRLGSHGNLSEREKETLRAVYLARLVPRYQKHGYLRQLLERAERDGETAALEEEEEDKEVEEDEEDEERCEETDDEVFLLNALEVAKIVKRPRKKKFGRPVKDDHARIMTEVETVRAD